MAFNNYPSMEAPHNIVLESRERCTVSGVIEVLSFDEGEIVMETTHGLITVGGESLNVERLNLDVGELSLSGQVAAIIYSDGPKDKKSFWSKLF